MSVTVDRIEQLKVRCYKILPLVYDNSLSYYEVLCKCVKLLNDVIEVVNSQSVIVEGIDERFDAIETNITDIESNITQLSQGVTGCQASIAVIRTDIESIHHDLTLVTTSITNINNQKMDKADPTGTGKLSVNRKPNTNGGDYSVAVGYQNEAYGSCSFAEGNSTRAMGDDAHAEGNNAYAGGVASHAEGASTNVYADATAAHAEGGNTVAHAIASHAEGQMSQAYGQASHAEGSNTYVGKNPGGTTYLETNGAAAHVEGNGSKSYGDYSHAEGWLTEARGTGHHAEGVGTISNYNVNLGGVSVNRGQHVAGRFNHLVSPSTAGVAMRITGGGESDNARKTVEVLDINGNLFLSGAISIGMSSTDTTGFVTLNKDTLSKIISSIIPVTDVDPNDPQHSLSYMNTVESALFAQFPSGATRAFVSIDSSGQGSAVVDNTLHSTLSALRTTYGNTITVVKVGNTNRTLVFKFDNTNNGYDIYTAEGFIINPATSQYYQFKLIVTWNSIGAFIDKY